jgi:hypothetical protein
MCNNCKLINLRILLIRLQGICCLYLLYIFKKVKFGNTYEFLFLFYYYNLIYKSKRDIGLSRVLFDVPFGLYNFTLRVKNNYDKNFEIYLNNSVLLKERNF